MRETNPVFSEDMVKGIKSKKDFQGLETLDTKETVILMWDDFHTRLKVFKRYLIGAVWAMWIIAGGIIINLLIALITK